MVKAVRMHEAGGPEVLHYEDVTLPDPGPGEALVRHEAIGLNYIDVYHRTGLYPVPSLPWPIGMEGAGVVEAVGEGVTEVSAGMRVAYASPPPPGGYSEARVMPAGSLVELPADISFEQGAAMMLQGMTVEYLIRRTYPVKAGETVLVHAAAGGVGLIQCQWLKHLGATVIGTVGSEEKAALARAHGCDHPVMYRTEDFAERVMEITEGQGVPVVYDSIGADTLEGSLNSLAAAGDAGELRQCLRSDHGLQLGETRAQERLHHAAHSLRLQRDPRGARGIGRRPLRRRALRRRQNRDPPDLPARRGRSGASRPGGPEDHGLDDPDPLTDRRETCRSGR